MKNIVIYGLGDFASLLRNLIEVEGKRKVLGFCANKEYIFGNTFSEKPVTDINNLQHVYSQDDVELIVAIGYKSMRARELMFQCASDSRFKVGSWVSRNAHVDPSATLGENSIVFPGVQIEPFATLGNNCVVWSSSVICHHSEIGDHCFIAAQSLVGGRAKLGSRSFMGFNSTLIQDMCVGSDCLVGAKSLVTADIPSFSKCIGVPAKVVSKHESVFL